MSTSVNFEHNFIDYRLRETLGSSFNCYSLVLIGIMVQLVYCYLYHVARVRKNAEHGYQKNSSEFYAPFFNTNVQGIFYVARFSCHKKLQEENCAYGVL